MSQAGPDPANDDQELVERAGQGDHRAFETLYYRYRDWVTNLAWRFTHDRDLSLDVLQETFAYLVRRIPTLRLRGRLTTFLYPVVKHVSLDLCRQRRIAADNPAISAAAVQPARDTSADLGDGIPMALTDLHRAVEHLPDGQREVLLMRFVSGMDLAEIALALDIPVGTVKSRLHGALTALAGRFPFAAR